MQLHRLWIEFEDGSGAFSPYKQTEVALVVKPAEHLSYSLRADAPGRWTLRSPLIFNLQSGVFRTEALTTIHTVRCGLFELQGQLSTRCGLAAILFLTASRSLVPVDARTAPQCHDRSTGSMPGLPGGSARKIGPGFSNIETGGSFALRSQPQIRTLSGFRYNSGFGRTAGYARQAGQPASGVRLIF